ncbi:hypothetical protein CLV98_107104 [Dyadobacter jejuensis]|uniref:Uncharacterized protein n=1 Tax=Dyadobacter jejuensis TaxID=1082580 RepID=A0A316B486_9BACT|nr:hypothetical protein [Dyadobacter jejuensis]PWJ57397.1 hypothetical protein CLV98_107104 [Dyadobacter jejuensis]
MKALLFLALFILSTAGTYRNVQAENQFSKDCYIVCWGEFGLGYITIDHLCIANVAVVESAKAEEASEYFNSEVYIKFPAAKNPYSSGYKSYYRTFDDRYEARTFRNKLIDKAKKVDHFSI